MDETQGGNEGGHDGAMDETRNEGGQEGAMGETPRMLHFGPNWSGSPGSEDGW